MACFFLKSGDFLWNAGIFIWNVKSIIAAFEKHTPEMHELFNAGKLKYNTADEALFIKGVYTECKNISIDYAVLEKAMVGVRNILEWVVELDVD